MLNDLSGNIQAFDERRDIAILEGHDEMIRFATRYWMETARRSISEENRFTVALSGGVTPQALYQNLCRELDFDWKRVWLFWSDERAVPPEHPDSNYHSAMTSGLNHLSIPSKQIFRMQGELESNQAAANYEALIKKSLGKSLFDLVMLGLGSDGHTASLFPKTAACLITKNLVVANFIPHLKTWRLTLTIPCINQSRRALFLVSGHAKQNIVKKVLEASANVDCPASLIGTKERKALWILDREAAAIL